MAQGWQIDPTADTITFNEQPPVGVNNIVVNQFAAGGYGGTDVWAVGAWSKRYGYPSEGEFAYDRLWLASTRTDPQTIWGSCIGDYTNHGRSSPIVDSDAVSFAINARQVNVIKDLIPLDNLMLMTTGGEFRMTAGQDDVVTPSTIGAKNQGNSGIGDVQACVIGESALYVQEEGQKIKDLRYQFEKDGFRGNDISVWADHLFAGYEVVWMDYWKAPWQVAWIVRDDGVLVGCTYLPEQEVIGWHWHDTDGEYLDSASLPGKKETENYSLVRRFVNGESVQYLEQQAPTRYDTEEDLFYVDCGVTYDGRNTGSTTLTITTAAGWTEDDDLTITASASLFTGVSDEGDGFEIKRTVMTVVDGVQVFTEYKVRMLIDEYLTATTVRAHSIGSVPTELQDQATVDWTFQRDTIGDLWHLEGKLVSVLQDAAVAGPFPVVNGQIELQTPGGVVQVGLKYSCEVETLELNQPGGESIRDSNKLAYSVNILLLASRGVRFSDILESGKPGTSYPAKERRFENYGQPPYLKTGIIEGQINAGWGVNAGRIRITSDDPLPMEILNITTNAAVSK